MRLNSLKIGVLFLLIISVSACESEYTKLVKSELASGKINDSVFYGLKFGQTKNDFFNICWDLNKKHLVTHGGNNSYVQTMLHPKDSTKTIDKIVMLFYAKFNTDNIITAMDVKFSYLAWAPWNKDLTSEKLLPKIQDTLMKWYPGNPFIKVKNDILVKVDGNRQIQLSKGSDRDVSVLIEDLAYKYNNMNK
jgi:hypothetical protein